MVLSQDRALCVSQTAVYEGVETVRLPHSLGGVIAEEAWKQIQQQQTDN